jgi:hypothetical protein
VLAIGGALRSAESPVSIAKSKAPAPAAPIPSH